MFIERVNGLGYTSCFNPGAESWAFFGVAGSLLAVNPSGAIDGAAAAQAAGIGVMPEPPLKLSVRMVPSSPG